MKATAAPKHALARLGFTQLVRNGSGILSTVTGQLEAAIKTAQGHGHPGVSFTRELKYEFGAVRDFTCRTSVPAEVDARALEHYVCLAFKTVISEELHRSGFTAEVSAVPINDDTMGVVVEVTLLPGEDPGHRRLFLAVKDEL